MRYNASKIAALLGKFGPKQRAEAILEQWQKTEPKSLIEALERRAGQRTQISVSAQPIPITATQVPIAVPNVVQALLDQPCTCSQQVQERKTAVRKAISESLPAISETIQATISDHASAPVPAPVLRQVQAALIEHCEKEINTDFGTQQESPVIKRFAAKIGQEVLPDLLLHCKYYDRPDQHILAVQGKVDGRLADGRVVEIKNRVRRLFHTVRDYEMIQVQTYLELLDAPSAYLCEAYNNELDWKEIQRDSDWWQRNVLQPLIQHDLEFEQLLQSKEKQDYLLSSLD